MASSEPWTKVNGWVNARGTAFVVSFHLKSAANDCSILSKEQSRVRSEKIAVDPPLVSVILPIRNEASHIGRSLQAVCAQDYCPHRLEILVVDGMSDDSTRSIVTDFMARDARVRLLDNPRRIVPTALNRGIAAANGDILIRVDGHAVIAADYVRRCVADLERLEVDCVGGPIDAAGETYVARAIAIAQSSPFGVGNAAFRHALHSQYVDTLAFGAYKSKVFERIGLFDEELVRNQDDEFNFRLVRAGGKIWLDTDIRSTYYSRATLRGLWKQYLQYGFWKVRVIQKHRRPASWRHLVPGSFVLALVGSLVLSGILSSPLTLLFVCLPYAGASFLASLWTAARRGWQYAPVLPLAFAAMHLAYGIGFLGGLARFGLARRSVPRTVPHLTGDRLAGVRKDESPEMARRISMEQLL
jgi:glycosyltransferase involved in cell wall biosynthesis